MPFFHRRTGSSGSILAGGLAAALVAFGLSTDGLAAQGLPARGLSGDTAGVVRGVVTSAADSAGRPLSGVWVEIRETRLAADTDRSGRYRLDAVPPGVRRLRIRGLGYRPLDVEVRVPPGDSVRLDFVLDPEPLLVRGVAVRADPVRPRLSTSAPTPEREATLGPRILSATPGVAEAGIGGVARHLPSDGEGDPARVLLMRGSTADETLVLLDGAPVYAPFHLGGLVSSFDPDLLASARHYVGGAPSRYDGGLSYVLDLRTRSSGEAGRASAFVDAVSAGGTVEGPIGDAASVLVSGRALHGGYHPLRSGPAPPYGYGDLLIRGDVHLSEGHRIAGTGFWNGERVRLTGAPETPTDGPEIALAPEIVRPEAARWGNGAFSLRYLGNGDETEAEVTLAASRYHAALPLGHETPAAGRARTDRIRLAAEMGRSVGPTALRLGVSAEGIDHTRSARAIVRDSLFTHRDRTRSGALALYVDGSRRITDQLRLRGGLRLDHFPDLGGIRPAPRLALTWLLTDEAALTLAAGRFHQLPRGGELEIRMARADPAGLETGQAVFQPARATHFVLALDQTLAPSLRLGLEGYVKGFRDLPGVDGVLRSSGVDVRIMREGEPLGGWLGYSLAWFWEPGRGTTPAASDSFTGRHLLTAGLEGTLFGFLDGSARLAYGDGLPYTSIPFADGADQERTVTGVLGAADESEGGIDRSTDAADRIPTLDGFLRLDLEVGGGWDVEWGERVLHLRPYARLMNALSRRDALFYYFEPWRDDGLRAVAERPVLPVVGLSLEVR